MYRSHKSLSKALHQRGARIFTIIKAKIYVYDWASSWGLSIGNVGALRCTTRALQLRVFLLYHAYIERNRDVLLGYI